MFASISQETLAALARLTRAMPRNPDVIALSDAISADLAAKPVAVTATPAVAVTDCPACEKRRRAQRAKMKKYRSKPKPK